jgi:ABC-type transporter Mla MlaB component
MLRITVHEAPEILTFQLEGSLAGPWLRELEYCWRESRARTAPSPPSEGGARGGRILRIDLTGVTHISSAGQACLAEMHRQGAEFVAADCLTKGIVDEITKAPFAIVGSRNGNGRCRPKRNRGAT